MYIIYVVGLDKTIGVKGKSLPEVAKAIQFFGKITHFTYTDGAVPCGHIEIPIENGKIKSYDFKVLMNMGMFGEQDKQDQPKTCPGLAQLEARLTALEQKKIKQRRKKSFDEYRSLNPKQIHNLNIEEMIRDLFTILPGNIEGEIIFDAGKKVLTYSRDKDGNILFYGPKDFKYTHDSVMSAYKYLINCYHEKKRT